MWPKHYKKIFLSSNLREVLKEISPVLVSTFWTTVHDIITILFVWHSKLNIRPNKQGMFNLYVLRPRRSPWSQLDDREIVYLSYSSTDSCFSILLWITTKASSYFVPMWVMKVQKVMVQNHISKNWWYHTTEKEKLHIELILVLRHNYMLLTHAFKLFKQVLFDKTNGWKYVWAYYKAYS